MAWVAYFFAIKFQVLAMPAGPRFANPSSVFRLPLPTVLLPRGPSLPIGPLAPLSTTHVLDRMKTKA